VVVEAEEVITRMIIRPTMMKNTANTMAIMGCGGNLYYRDRAEYLMKAAQ